MRLIHTAILPITALAFCACRPAVPLDVRRGSPVQPADALTTALTPPITPAVPTPSSPASSPTLLRKTIKAIEFEGVAFDSRSYHLLVIDQPLGPGSAFDTSEDVAREYGALLAINAGFFTPEGKPLGLVISNGRRSGAWNSASSLGSGIFSENLSAGLSIFRRNSPAAASEARELIQAGPLFIENGRRVGGLDGEKTAVRSILVTDGGNRWWIGKTSPCTLASLGSALSIASPTSWPTRNALNLDGGRSTDLFVSGKVPGGPINRRGFLNRPVRNFLILKPR
jgi:hypothetical protein